MESYRMANSSKVKEKCEKLGLTCDVFGWSYEDPFLVVNKTKYFSTREYNVYSENVQEITQADFLALPEPIEEGDFVKLEAKDKEYTLFGKIKKIHRQDKNKGHLDLEGAEEGFFLECHNITKLADEQVKILGLE